MIVFGAQYQIAFDLNGNIQNVVNVWSATKGFCLISSSNYIFYILYIIY